MAFEERCSGTGSNYAPSPCISNNSLCLFAPKIYYTDALCKLWG